MPFGTIFTQSNAGAVAQTARHSGYIRQLASLRGAGLRPFRGAFTWQALPETVTALRVVWKYGRTSSPGPSSDRERDPVSGVGNNVRRPLSDATWCMGITHPDAPSVRWRADSADGVGEGSAPVGLGAVQYVVVAALPMLFNQRSPSRCNRFSVISGSPSITKPVMSSDMPREYYRP